MTIGVLDKDGAAQTINTLADLMGASNKTITDLATAIAATNTKLDTLTSDLVAGTLPVGAGTAAAAGRTTLASDDPAVAVLGTIAGTKVVTDANGTIQEYLRGIVTFFANSLGAGTAAAAERVTLASDDPAVASLAKFSTGKYVAVAASQTNSVIQLTTGAIGDYLDHVIVIPATTAPGVVTIKDNATALISYPGGETTALLTLTPFTIYVGAASSSGAWKITTGANVSILAVGKFS